MLSQDFTLMETRSRFPTYSSDCRSSRPLRSFGSSPIVALSSLRPDCPSLNSALQVVRADCPSSGDFCSSRMFPICSPFSIIVCPFFRICNPIWDAVCIFRPYLSNSFHTSASPKCVCLFEESDPNSAVCFFFIAESNKGLAIGRIGHL
jgi:hypothetical protein